jgi:hypothetical protein
MILDLRDVTANDKITGNEDLQGVFDATETALVLGLLLLTDDEMALAIHDLSVWAGDRAEIGYEVSLEDLRERANDYPALMPLWTALSTVQAQDDDYDFFLVSFVDDDGLQERLEVTLDEAISRGPITLDAIFAAHESLNVTPQA